MYTPNTEKIKNASILSNPSGVSLFNRYPTSIPRISAIKSPSEHPIQTTSADPKPSFAPKVMAVSCVLSPSSATKKVQKTASGANLIFDLPPSSSSSSSSLAIVDTAKYRNASAATTLINQSGMNALTSPPARTASPLSIRIATAVPNIMSLNLYLDVRAINIS